MEITDRQTYRIDFIDEFEREWVLFDATDTPVHSRRDYTDAAGDVFAVDLGSARGGSPWPVVTIRWKRLHGVDRLPWVVATASAAELMPSWAWRLA